MFTSSYPFLHSLSRQVLKSEDLAIIKKSSDLQSCFTAFEVIKIMPHLGELIKTNIKKENAQAIAEYINNEEQELIKEFGEIEEGYGSDEQLSFVLKYLLDTIEHIILKSHINERTQKDKGADAVSLAQKANTFLNKLKDVCQNPSTVSTKPQLEGIEPLAKRQRMER
ncbi:MAG: hypothetical protein sL5_04100 [Candidatus Mesenet longicola]|uniref:Uncharacterized protein n=1 Tax=Candidatus Mesenet longicola TaxID=1892558 RepID=A0A8J3MMQ8_9RICK|nr:MAG: hypothetical protein sGL2_04230 [Candidatus Mesenet longicola]GHM59417.1 MAG: hypothetical protein sL5_04100 [Candidatus Mesenet longicola]